MANNPLPLLQGTLDLLVLKCLSGGAQHGYAIAAMVREHTEGDLSVEDSALYQSLHRLIVRISSTLNGVRRRTTAGRDFTR